MYEQVIELNSLKPGPTSIILVGVHGNEKCGIEAIRELLPQIKIQKGKVFVCYGNPKAIEQNIRYTEANLNRMFKQDEDLTKEDKESYEYSRAQFLKTYLDQADYLLDIHASFTPQSQIFIICENNSENITKYLPSPLIVYGFDNVEPGGTDYYMNKIGKVGICIECGFLGDLESNKIAQKSITSFLVATGQMEGEKKLYPQNIIQMTELYLTKSDNFILSKTFKDFEELKKGEIIGNDGKEKILAKTDGIILFARSTKKVGGEAFLFGKHKFTSGERAFPNSIVS